jgi:hypothetical protein
MPKKSFNKTFESGKCYKMLTFRPLYQVCCFENGFFEDEDLIVSGLDENDIFLVLDIKINGEYIDLKIIYDGNLACTYIFSDYVFKETAQELC